MMGFGKPRPHAFQSLCSGARECVLNHQQCTKTNTIECTHKIVNTLLNNRVLRYFITAFFMFMLFTPTAFAIKAGDIVDSDASTDYRYNNQFFSQSDNAPFVVEAATDAAPASPGTSAAIDVWGPVLSPASDKDLPVTQSQCHRVNSSNSTFSTQLHYANGEALNLPSLISAQESDEFKAGNPVIIRIIDLDENIDPNAIDQLRVTLTSNDPNDSETLILLEKGMNSGEFIGIIQTRATTSAVLNDCNLALTSNSVLNIHYQDEQDKDDELTKVLRFDPYHKVFNAYSGEPVNGVTLRLINNTTGLLAQVFGDDGVSAFPAEIQSGARVQDSSGKIYSFPDGGYRFPYVTPGDYRIEIIDTVIFRFPSQTSDAAIQTLDGAPYVLNDLSRGLPYTSNNLLLTADIPLDPLENRILLEKSSRKSQAGVGDFVAFDISLINVDADINDVQILDTLPTGLRYVANSLRINGVDYDDMSISDNGRALSINFSSIAANENIAISYVTQVSATATGTLENRVQVQHALVKSNVATAVVEIQDDLMREKSQVFGRVILDDCAGNLDAEGLAGIRLLMEDGRYVITDNEGQWHFEGIAPGTHVIQLDTATLPPYLEVTTCDNEFFHAGRNYSQFIDVQPGTLWRADFHIQPKTPERGDVVQTLFNQLTPLTQQDIDDQYRSPVSDKIIYRAHIGGSGIALNNVVEEITLPEGVEVQAGTLTLDGQSYPYQYKNNRMFIHLGNKPKVWQHDISFHGIITMPAKKGSLEATARLNYEIGPLLKDKTPLAKTRVNLFIPPKDGKADPLKNPKFETLSNVLTAQDKNNLSDVIFALDGLKDLEISVTGHTDNVPIAARNQHIYADNQALSEARAAAVAEYISQQINLPLQNIKVSGLGKLAPIAPNNSPTGRAKNRRVEVRVLKATPDVAVASLDIDVQLAQTESMIPGLDAYQATAAGALSVTPQEPSETAQNPQPNIDDDWFKSKRVESDWVWPPQGYSPDISALNVIIQHPKNNRIRLTLNGVPVHSIYFEGIKRANGKAVAVSEWRGINIDEGKNQFVAEILDRDENVIDFLAQDIFFSGAAAQAEQVPELSNTIADGINPPVIAVRFTDKNGHAVRKNTQGELQISDPFQLLQRNEYDISPLNDTHKLSYRVERDGIAFIKLQPTTRTGEVTLTFQHSNDTSDEVRSWLKPAPRDWILVALGDLTLGANAATQKSRNNANGAIENDLYHQGRLAFYSKGQIAGDYLLTAAYDSNKQQTTPFATLVQPGEYYTLYADASQQGQDASSGDKLYIKIEKDRFYALYGDLNTGLDKTVLSRYVRNLTGAQVVYQNDLVELSGFASEADSTFSRDEIPANGTSGLYTLNNKFIVLNSDTLRLETRDRFNNQVVIKSQTLTRNLDYSLDYNSGSLYFKSPIPTTDERFNPIYIVADYETEDSDGGYLIGGRAGIKLLDDTLNIGITTIDENKKEHDSQLNGLDAQLTLGNLTLSTEIAHTQANSDKASAHAKRIEAKYRTGKAEITAYSQRIDGDFGLDQQNQANLNQQSTGVSADIYITEFDKLELDSLYQTQISTGYDKQQAAAKWTHNLTHSSEIHAGLSSNIQEGSDQTRFVDELSLGASAPVISQDLRMNITATTDISQRSEDNDRIKLGAEYRWNDSLSSFANYERSFNTNNLERTAIGLKTQPWQGGQVDQSLVQENQNDGYRLYSESGLSHDWKIDQHWLISFGYNQSKNLAHAQPEEQTVAEDYHAISSGWGYRSQRWQWTNRLERRIASSQKTHSAHTSLYHPLSSAMAIGGSLDFYKQESDEAFEKDFETVLDFAIRPRQQPFAFLLQTRWIHNEQSNQGVTQSNDKSRRMINNAHLNWQFNRRNQLATQYGFKHVLDQYENDDYSANVHYLAGEWRHNINQRWDIGAHARELIGGDSQQNGYGVSVGIRPVTNVWASLGYNIEGFVDTDFSAANYTAQGVYLKLRFKADQDTLSSLRQAFYW